MDPPWSCGHVEQCEGRALAPVEQLQCGHGAAASRCACSPSTEHRLRFWGASHARHHAETLPKLGLHTLFVSLAPSGICRGKIQAALSSYMLHPCILRPNCAASRLL
jgi:hypothetical protein